VTIAVEMENVSFSYGDNLIIKKATVSIAKGDFVGVIGPNGGGKTTFLKLIMGLLSPNEGIIKVFDHSPKEERKNIGYVPQRIDVDKDFPITVLELVLMGALAQIKPFGNVALEIKQRALSLLDQMGISHLQKTSFQKLSGGQLQRAFIARALLSDPDILILDEPTASIDPEAEKMIFDLLASFKEKKTILMVSHDLNAIITQVKSIISVQQTVQYRLPEEVCEHFAMGLYHVPLMKANKEHKKGKM